MGNHRTWIVLGTSLMLLASPAFAIADDTAAASTSSAATLPTATSPATMPQGLLPIPDYTGDLWSRSYLTGDWGGSRTALADKGFQLDADWTQYVQSIVSGGRESETVYGGHGDYLLHLDLMRMGVLPGALVTIRAESRYGQSVNGHAGPILPVNTTAFFPLTSQLDGDVGLNITDLNLTQFLSPNLAVVVGKLDTLDADPNEFASGRGKSQFMDANFLFNSVAALRLPYSTLGAGVLWLPAQNITVNGSIINTQDSSDNPGFNDFGNGNSVSGEVDTQYHLGDLPGGFNIGGLYSFNQNFTKVTGEIILQPGQHLALANTNSTWAVYGSMWQYLYVADPNDKPINPGAGEAHHQGFGLFARLGFADPDTNPTSFSTSIGLGGKGMIPSRKNDTYGIGYYYTTIQQTRLTGLVVDRGDSQGMEAYYNIALTPAAHLTFDVQYHEPAIRDVESVVVLGMRLNLQF